MDSDQQRRVSTVLRIKKKSGIKPGRMKYNINV
jgi:hypothetical protein